MTPPRIARLLLCVTALTLAGCGDGAAARDRAAARDGAAAGEPTAGGASGTDLCVAAGTWNEEFDRRATEVDANDPAAFGAVLRDAAAGFSRDVVPAAPADLHDEAVEMADLMADAGDELVATEPGSTVDDLLFSGEATRFGEFVAMMRPVSVDPADLENTTYRYANELVAWLEDPCGPKDLEFDRAPEFHSIAASI